jgi:superfamily II DNA or RNA helicase
MPEIIYVLVKLYYYRNICKIGSTRNLNKRIRGYITPEPNFNDNTHELYSFTIKKSKYSCYQLDMIIQYMSITYSIPYKKYNGDGGIEHYKYTNINELIYFLKKLDVEFEFKKEIINEIKNDKIDIIESLENNIKDIKLLRNIFLSDEEKEYIKKKIKPFQLKQFQIEIRQKFNELVNKLRLFHLVISPTGTGKTLSFCLMILDEIKRSGKDIMIITKKKEILYQMCNDTIKKNIDNLIEKNIVNIENNFIYTNCLDECDIKIINKKCEMPQIYIINFDKFTSTNEIKDNHEKIKFDKFGLIIVNESHNCGAEQVYKFMNHIKINTKCNVVGLSATPLRCQSKHKKNTEDLFSTKNVINILYEYSYYDALIINKDICPIRWKPISLNLSDFIEVEKDNDTDDNIKEIKYKQLKPDSYKKVIDILSINIFNNSFKKKGIFWFRNRRELLSFYEHMLDELKDFKIFCTMTFDNSDNMIIKNNVDKCGLSREHFDTAIEKFLSENKKAILFAVGRCCEGFDDDKIDFCVRMYYSLNIDPVLETQRMGRLNRWYRNDINKKKIGYFCTLEIKDDITEMRKNILKRLKSWIEFIREYDKSSDNIIKTRKIEEYRKIIDSYASIEDLKMNDIDIEKDIEDMMKKQNYTKEDVRNAIRQEKKKGNIIDTKPKYDKWSEDNNYPDCDMLEDMGIIKNNELKILFELEYMDWNNFKNFCMDYKKKRKPKITPVELYNKMKDEYNDLIPDEPDIYYSEQFTNFYDLFN